MTESGYAVDAHDARAIANAVIRIGIEAKRRLTPLQVVKLTYLCHGWMLGLYDCRLSEQPVEAWRYGPVIPDVYNMVKVRGRREITKPFDVLDAHFDDKQQDLMKQVCDAYREYSGIQLSMISHEEGTPWYAIRHKYGRDAIIPNSMIRDHFANLAES